MKAIYMIIVLALNLTVLAEDKGSQVKNDIKALSQATYTNKPETILKYTMPKIIEMMGGEEKAKITLSTILNKMQYITLDSLTFPKEPSFIEGTKYEYVIIPTLSIVSANGQRIESLNFQVGQRLKSTEKWYYIEGSRVNQNTIPIYLPELPKNQKLPEFYRKKIK